MVKLQVSTGGNKTQLFPTVKIFCVVMVQSQPVTEYIRVHTQTREGESEKVKLMGLAKNTLVTNINKNNNKNEKDTERDE